MFFITFLINWNRCDSHCYLIHAQYVWDFLKFYAHCYQNLSLPFQEHSEEGSAGSVENTCCLLILILVEEIFTNNCLEPSSLEDDLEHRIIQLKEIF